MAAVPAGAAAGGGHPCLLLLARVRVAPAEPLPELALRRQGQLRRAGELPEAARLARLLCLHRQHRHLFGQRDRVRGRGGPPRRRARKPADPGAHRLPRRAPLALRHRPARGRDHLPLHLPPVVRDPPVLPRVRDVVRVQLAPQGVGGDGPGDPGHGLDPPRLQHRLLPGRPPGHPGLGAGGGQRGRRRRDPAVLPRRVSAPLPDHLFPRGGQHGLLLLRDLRGDPRGDAGRPRGRHRDHGVQGVQGRLRSSPPSPSCTSTSVASSSCSG